MRRSKKVRILRCGFCFICNKELLSNIGGWVINAERRFFCHSGDGDCFDRYHQDNLRRRAAENKREEKYYAAKC
jgi:hypothetical protein